MNFHFLLSVYTLISRRRFQQMEVLEGQNILVTISGKKNKIRVYYLSWLNNKIFKKEAVSLNMYNYICSKLEHNFFFF